MKKPRTQQTKDLIKKMNSNNYQKVHKITPSLFEDVISEMEPSV